MQTLSCPRRTRTAPIALIRALAVPAVLALPAPGPAAAEVRVLVPPSAMHAIEGIDMGGDGMIYGTSIHGQAVYRIDPRTGRVDIAVPSPQGESDDVTVGKPGTPAAGLMAWTAQRTGEVRLQRPGGPVEVILPNAPRVNPIAFNAQGRLFAAQSGAGEDALWELGAVGGAPPRIVAKNKGRLNGFGFGPDGRLYAPHFGTDRLFAIDVDSGEFTVIAEGVGAPAAAKVDAQGRVYSIDYLLGDLWRTDLTANTSEIVARFREPIDNLTIAADGTIYISNVADSAVYAYDPATGARRDVVVGYFTTALGMTWAPHRGRPQLLVADPFGYRFVDPTTGTVDRPFWAANRGASSAVAADARVIAWSYAGSGRVRVLDRQSDRLVVDSTAIKTPRGIVLVPDGGVIVADAEGGRLARVTAEGVSTVADGLRRPVGLTLDGAAAVLVTEFEAGTVSRVELATGRRTELARGLQRPAGVARMADGRIAVIEPAARRISAVTPGTGARTTLADALPLALDRLDVAQDSPVGIAVGPDGTVYASCPGDNSIVALAPTAPQTRRQ